MGDETEPNALRSFDAADDAALVAAALEGRRDAFDVLVERHQRQVYHVCYRLAGTHEDASDLTQDTFVRAWRGLARFKGQSALSTWLYRIAVNTSLNHVAARRPAAPIDEAALAETHEPDGRARLLAVERSQQVRAAIRDLPTKQRATLILRAYHELSHREIATILGSSVGTVKANFFHALANLKKRLGGQP